MKKILKLAAAVTVAILAQSALAAESAKDFPSKPIQLIVPFSAGGASDALARTLSQKLSEEWKQSVIVVNKPGADGNLGAFYVANAAKDGYTLMVLDIGTLTMGPIFYKSLSFDPSTAFSPVTLLTFSPHVLVVNPKLPVHTFKELLDYAKANPDKLNFASHNNSASLAGYKLQTDTGLQMAQIPYKGAGAAITAMIGGEVNLTLSSLFLTMPHIQSGAVRAIAVASPKRMSVSPDVPTLIEAGVPNYVMGSWQGVLAPAGTPKGIVDKLNATIRKILKEPDVKQRLEAQGAEIIGNSPQEFETLLKEQINTFQTTAKQAHIQPQ